MLILLSCRSMSIKTMLLILPCLLMLCSPGQLWAGENKKKVAVIEFDTKGDFAIPYAGSIVAEWMISELGKLDSFTLVERVLLKKVIAEQQLGQTGLLSQDKSSTQLGKIFGVDAIITGGVLKWQQSITITARLIDASSGSILRTSSVTARHINQAPQLIGKLARDLSGLQSAPPSPPPISTPIMGAMPKMRLTPEPASQPHPPTLRQWQEELSGITFVWIKGDCFVMGQSPVNTPDARSASLFYSDENPAHRVCLDGFWLANTEISNGQYRQLRPEHNSGQSKGHDLNGDNLPAVMISWQEARAFAAELNDQYANKGASFRLPTEAEWEYAARAGSSSPFPWPQHELCQRANSQTPPCADGHAGAAPVSAYQANAFGLANMLGNVWEWVEDIYNSTAYLQHDRNNPLYLGVGNSRVIRGGSWQDETAQLRSANRSHHDPGQASPVIGFRLVMERK